MIFTREVRDRFLEKIHKDPQPNGCWLWTGAKDKDGYGVFRVGTGTCRANRVAYFLWNGPLDSHKKVRHDCDTPACVNPRHLKIGTHQQNMDDMRQRERAVTPNRKIPVEDHETIRRQVIHLHVPMARVARKYGVTEAAISRIVKGHNGKVDVDLLEV